MPDWQNPLPVPARWPATPPDLQEVKLTGPDTLDLDCLGQLRSLVGSRVPGESSATVSWFQGCVLLSVGGVFPRGLLQQQEEEEGGWRGGG